MGPTAEDMARDLGGAIARAEADERRFDGVTDGTWLVAPGVSLRGTDILDRLAAIRRALAAEAILRRLADALGGEESVFEVADAAVAYFKAADGSRVAP
jgi:hypothetical protein